MAGIAWDDYDSYDLDDITRFDDANEGHASVPFVTAIKDDYKNAEDTLDKVVLSQDDDELDLMITSQIVNPRILGPELSNDSFWEMFRLYRTRKSVILTLAPEYISGKGRGKMKSIRSTIFLHKKSPSETYIGESVRQSVVETSDYHSTVQELNSSVATKTGSLAGISSGTDGMTSSTASTVTTPSTDTHPRDMTEVSSGSHNLLLPKETEKLLFMTDILRAVSSQEQMSTGPNHKDDGGGGLQDVVDLMSASEATKMKNGDAKTEMPQDFAPLDASKRSKDSAPTQPSGRGRGHKKNPTSNLVCVEAGTGRGRGRGKKKG